MLTKEHTHQLRIRYLVSFLGLLITIAFVFPLCNLLLQQLFLQYADIVVRTFRVLTALSLWGYFRLGADHKKRANEKAMEEEDPQAYLQLIKLYARSRFPIPAMPMSKKQAFVSGLASIRWCI
jgi:hypothetical protein